MTRKLNKTFFLILIGAAGAILSSCQSNPKNDKLEIQQVDTPPQLNAPIDGIKQPATDTIKRDTANTNNMKDNASKKKPLILMIDNLGSPTAPVEVSVYSPDNKFPSENGQLKKYRFKPSGDKLRAEITDLEYGKYAVATYQDLDADGKIGKNMIGIPTDPYAFSNNYVPRIKAPAFKDCSFDYDAASASINISMIRK